MRLCSADNFYLRCLPNELGNTGNTNQYVTALISQRNIFGQLSGFGNTSITVIPFTAFLKVFRNGFSIHSYYITYRRTKIACAVCIVTRFTGHFYKFFSGSRK